MHDSYDKYRELQLQSVEPDLVPTSPPMTDLAARLAIMLCDDPTDPDLIGIESYIEIARRH